MKRLLYCLLPQHLDCLSFGPSFERQNILKAQIYVFGQYFRVRLSPHDMNFQHHQQSKHLSSVLNHQVDCDTDFVLDWHALPGEKSAWVQQKWLPVNFFIFHQRVEAMLNFLNSFYGKLIVKQAIDCFFLRVTDNLHVTEHGRPQLLKSTGDAAVEDPCVWFKSDVVVHQEVFAHESFLFFLHPQHCVRLIKIQSHRLLLICVIVEKNSFNPIF